MLFKFSKFIVEKQEYITNSYISTFSKYNFSNTFYIVAMLINEAADACYLNIASPADLETAMTKGVNYPKGLLAWCNEWGAKATLNILESLQIRYGDDRYRPSPVLRDLAAQKTSFSL